MKKKISRRDFLKLCAGGVIGGTIAYNSVYALFRGVIGVEAAPGMELDEYDWGKHYWGFVVDTDRCIGCGRCVIACKLENELPLGPEYYRTWVERYVVTENGKILVDSPNAGRDGFKSEHTDLINRNLNIMKSFFVPKLCNQCDKPPCVQVCPTGATYLTKDGVILYNRKICVGCKYCIVACPYGARFLDPRIKAVDKCTFCYHRITKGFPPACVEACPVGARILGDLRDPESPVKKILRGRRVSVLKPTLGTDPKVYYIGLEKGVY